MTGSEDDKEYRGILNTILYIGWAILIFHIYVYCNGSFKLLGIPLGLLNKFIISLNSTTHLFDNLWAAKLAAVFMLLVYTFGNKTKKDVSTTWQQVYINGLIGAILLFGDVVVLNQPLLSIDISNLAYAILTVAGYLMLMKSGSYANRIINIGLNDDPFNKDNESFEQQKDLVSNDYSINIPTKYYYKGDYRDGYVNVVNPFRAAMVLGTPGSGKSFAVVNNYIRQHIEKGFAMYIYDFKFPDLSVIAFNYLMQNAHVYKQKYGLVPAFYVINFDDPRRSNRCNPLLPQAMTDILDAQEAARTIMLNMNKAWIAKQGDFFIESPINFLAAVIWLMKKINDKLMLDLEQVRLDTDREPGDEVCFCTFPHVIEMANRDYEEIFPIMLAEPELENVARPFESAMRKGALEQLEGQIASARIPLARLSSKSIYWVMTGNDFSLDINNPAEPKLLCVGNNPDRQDIYGAALGLYNSRLIKLINHKHKIPTSVIIDELPTIYLRGLDNLIATGRSNLISTCLGLQDLSQLIRDYGKDQATSIFNTIGNVFSGSVIGETAKALSSRFGKNVQTSQSFNFSERETTTNLSTRLDFIIPESVISNLSQGQFVGSVSDNFGEALSQKIFNAELVVSPKMIEELKNVVPIPANPAFKGINDQDMDEILIANYRKVKTDVSYIIRRELDLIRKDPELRILLKGLATKDPNYLVDSDEDE